MKTIPLLFATLALGALASAAITQEPIPDLKPPRPELPASAEGRQLWPWFAAGGFIAALGAVIFWPRRRVPPPPESPYHRAVTDLRALPPGAVEQVTAIFRRYVANALPVPGPGQTPEEMAAFLAKHPRWTPELTARFHRLFDPVELAKFAPVPPPPGDPLVAEAMSLLATIEEFRVMPAQP